VLSFISASSTDQNLNYNQRAVRFLCREAVQPVFFPLERINDWISKFEFRKKSDTVAVSSIDCLFFLVLIQIGFFLVQQEIFIDKDKKQNKRKAICGLKSKLTIYFFFLLPSSHKLRYYLTVLENYILELHKQ